MSARKTKKREFRQKYHQKLIKELSMTFFGDMTTKLELLRLFSKFRGIKKCSIDPYLQAFSDKEKEYLGIRLFQNLFKILKRIKHLKVQGSDFNFLEVHKNSKTEKTFLLLTCLESLTFHWLGYSHNTKSLEHLLNIIRLASKTKSWPKFKSLKIHFFEPGRYSWSRNYALPLESLQSLLKFLQDLKSCCGNFYKYLDVEQLTLPYFSDFNSEQAGILREISKMIPVIRSIDIGEFKYFAEVLDIFQHSTTLKKISLEIKDPFPPPQIQDKTADLSILSRMSGLRELKLRGDNKVRADLTLYSKFLAQIQTMTNLTAFSFDIGGGTILTERLKTDLARVISSLIELKSLKLRFWNRYGDTPDFLAFKNLWLGDIFEAIGKRTKLKNLFTSSCAFSNDLFVAFRRSLKRLKRLSDLCLANINCENFEEKERVKFWKGLSKLPKLENIDVSMAKPSSFPIGLKNARND